MTHTKSINSDYILGMDNEIVKPDRLLTVIQNYSCTDSVSIQINQKSAAKNKRSNKPFNKKSSKYLKRNITDTPFFFQLPNESKDRVKIPINCPIHQYLAFNDKLLCQLMSNSEPNLVYEYSSNTYIKHKLLGEHVKLKFLIPSKSCKRILVTDLGDVSSIAEYGSTFEHLITLAIFDFNVDITSSIFPLLQLIMNQSRSYFADIDSTSDSKVSGKKVHDTFKKLDNVCRLIPKLNQESIDYGSELDVLIDSHVSNVTGENLNDSDIINV